MLSGDVMRFKTYNNEIIFFEDEDEIYERWLNSEGYDFSYDDYERAKKQWRRQYLADIREGNRKRLLKNYPNEFSVSSTLGKQSPCMGACARFFGYAFTPKGKYKWLQIWDDLPKALSSTKFIQGDLIGQTGVRMPRMGYDTDDGWVQDTSYKGGYKRKSVKNRLNKKGIETVGSSRKEARKMAKEQESAWSLGFLVGVRGHILALNNQGESVVDTAPRKSDRRKFHTYEHLTLFERVKQKTIQREEAAKRKRSKKRKQREKKKNPPKKRRCPKGSVRNKKTGRCNKKR